MTVHLVRHAHAIGRSRWDGDDLERPLSPRGRRQAAGLVKLLGREPVARIVSSPATRCVDTVAPLAEEARLSVETDDRLGEDGLATDAFTVLLDLATGSDDGGSDGVVCTHGDLIPEVLRWLSGQGATLEGGQRWEKGSTWALEWGGDRFVAARYLPPVEA